jgi:hypothetical protein
MKLYTFFTDTHKIFLNQFIKTFPFESGLDLEIKYLPQECPTGSFHSQGWNKTMRKKIEYILYSLDKTNENDFFIHSDIDVQFFGDIKSDLQNIMDLTNYDILFQNDGGYLCNGFFICKKNKITVELFNDVFNKLDNYRNDQVAVNDLLRNKKIKYSSLPERYYTVGINHGLWSGEETEFYIPDDLIMHHANYTEGVENKIKLLNLIKEKYEKKG